MIFYLKILFLLTHQSHFFQKHEFRFFLDVLYEDTKEYFELYLPKMITTTREGFTHKLGALISEIYAIDFGWNKIFIEEIGASLIYNLSELSNILEGIRK